MLIKQFQVGPLSFDFTVFTKPRVSIFTTLTVVKETSILPDVSNFKGLYSGCSCYVPSLGNKYPAVRVLYLA
jgi:hypothetical protein